MTTKAITQPALNSPSWGQPLNDNFAAITTAFGNSVDITGITGNVALTVIEVGHMCLRCVGALTGNLTLQVPNGTAGQWVVVNATTDSTGGPWTVSITRATSIDAPIQIARGSARSVYADGTNQVVFADTIIIPGSDNQIIYNDAGVLAGSSTLTFDGAAVSVGNQAAITITGASWSSPTATVLLSNDPPIPVGSIVSITGVNPVGYNGSWVVTASSSTQVQFSVAVNPGNYISGGGLNYGNLNIGGSKVGGIASQALAEAGTNDTTIMTPLRVTQAIASELLLASGNVTSAAQLDIILSAYTGYSSFEVRFFNLLPVSNAVALYMQVSTNGGSSFVTTQDYRSYGNILNSNSPSVSDVVDSTTAGALYIGRSIGNTTFKKALGSIIFSPRSDGFSYMSRLSNESSSATDGLQQFCNGSHTSTNVNAIRLLMSAGNISTMSWSLYGSR